MPSLPFRAGVEKVTIRRLESKIFEVGDIIHNEFFGYGLIKSLRSDKRGRLLIELGDGKPDSNNSHIALSEEDCRLIHRKGCQYIGSFPEEPCQCIVPVLVKERLLYGTSFGMV